MTDFYVYIHRKATTGEIFYVGKGCGRRAQVEERTNHWHNVVSKHGCFIEIVESDLQEWYAFELEIGLIALYGRKDLKLGPLVNMTDGGDGSSGAIKTEEMKKAQSVSMLGEKRHKGFKHSDEAKKKMSDAKLNKKLSEEHKQKLRLSKKLKAYKPLTLEHKQKISRSMTGKTVSEETRKKLSDIGKARCSK